MKKGIITLGIAAMLIVLLTGCETNINDETAEELQGGEAKTEAIDKGDVESPGDRD